MVTSLRYVITQSTNPFYNLALEEYLLENVQEGECILYLWQNRQTVVIGRNQNAWGECRVQALEQAGGHLVRRLSGGGAVFHDLGNLNFTFLAGEKDYDVARQLKVIVGAVRAFGLNAQVSGRNDIAIDGRKFSGNAFYKTRGKCYHHGTLLINADMQAMGKYLSVSNEKLSSKGVKSVGARVVNLHALCEDITVLNMQRELLKAFGQVYELTPAPLCEHTLDAQILQQKQEKFSSWQWNFGSKIPFTAERHKRFAWGDLQLQLSVNEGVIQALRVYSDAMDQDIFLALEKALANCPLKRTALLERLAYIPNQTMQEEIVSLLLE